jgi:hypothetical protein
MAWQLSWFNDAREEPVEVFSSKAAAKRAAEGLAGELVWKAAVVLGDTLDQEEDVIVAASDTSPGGSCIAGEYIIGRASRDYGFGAPIHDYARVQQEDRDNPLVAVVHRTIRDGKFLAYQYTNSKRRTHPGLIRPTGWHTYRHTHDWAGGYTLCVVGYAYDHREERDYAIRRMTNVRVLDHPGDELARLGWAESGERAFKASGTPKKAGPRTEPVRPGLAEGDVVEHDLFGSGKVLHVDASQLRVIVSFATVGTKKLALSVAPLRARE